MLLSYNDDDEEFESEEEYYDSLEGDSWGTSEVGTWKDLA